MEKIFSRIVFWILFLLTISQCFSTLNLDYIATPVSMILDEISSYLPNLFAAALLILAAWLIASGLKYGTQILLLHLKLDETVEKHCNTEGRECALSNTISIVIAVLTWLLFLPAILSALKISGIAEPLQGMLHNVLTYLPNLAAGAVIAAGGLLSAEIAKRLTKKALSASVMDPVGQKIGLQGNFGLNRLAAPASVIVYALIALPVAAAVLDALKIEVLASSTGALLTRMLTAIGNVFGALVIILIAWLIGAFAGRAASSVLDSAGFNKLFRILGFVKEDAPETRKASDLAGKLTMFAAILFGIICALDLLEFRSLADVLRSFIPFCGRLLLAAVVFCLGICLSKIAVSSARSVGWETKLLLVSIRISILVFSGAIALYCTGIGAPIVHAAFLLIGGAIALAAALAFGLGGRDFAAKKIEEWNRKNSEK